MKIERISLQNFRCYQKKEFVFHPEFNLIVGQNATGKTTLLDALSLAAATWLLGFNRRYDKKTIVPSDSHLQYIEYNDIPTFNESWPVVVKAKGVLNGSQIEWERSKESSSGNTRYGNAVELISIAKEISVNLDSGLNLPLICSYGTMRLWQDPKQYGVTSDTSEKGLKPSRLDGYRHSVDPRISVSRVVRWFADEEWMSFQNGKESWQLKLVKQAVISCVESVVDLKYHPKRKQLLISLADGNRQPFSILSDGQRCLVAMVADLAIKAITLNPHLGSQALSESEGLVLIDELDLHLHPRWQRRVIDDLRNLFPKIQFICTTHSPFLIQSLRTGEELIMLDGTPAPALGNMALSEIAIGVMQINDPDVSNRYADMKSVALEYLMELEKSKKDPIEKLDNFKKKLAEKISPYADNPAYQAFLEMKRIVALGE